MGNASRAKRRAREFRRQQSMAQQELVDRVTQSLPAGRLKVVKRPTGRKVSEVLMEFSEPWLNEARNDKQRKTVIGMAVLAWNMAAIGELERWDGMSQEFGEKLSEAGKKILRQMIARRLSMYPEENRQVLDYQISGSGNDMRLDVVYSLSREEIAELKQREQGSAGH